LENEKRNILITSAGRRVALVKEFQLELKKIIPTGKVYCTDYQPFLSPACHVADGFFKVPIITNSSYINALIEICLSNNIGLIVPTIDTELIYISSSKERFLEAGVNCLVSSLELVQNCRDKRKTHLLFKKLGFNIAKEYTSENIEFPVFIKPIDGSGSKDIFIVSQKEDFNPKYINNSKIMLLEYLNPKLFDEYTIDLYYDKSSNLCCIVPRERLEVRAGEVSKGITRKNFLINFVRDRLSKIIGFQGCIVLQVFVHKKSHLVYGIEINPRFGGGFPLSYSAGANFPKWIIEEYFLKNKIEFYNEWEDNLLMLRYDNELLIHGIESNK
jgi:carbamoyl-phosphate synthase large subunit